MAGLDFGLHAILEAIARGFQVASCLHVEPVFRRGSEISTQPEGRLSGDRTLSGDDLADAVRRDVNLVGEPVHADAQVVQGFLKNLAWMNGRKLTGNVS